MSSYYERQEVFAEMFPVGSLVEVTTTASSWQDGWENGWVGQMDDAVGKVYEVLRYGAPGVKLSTEELGRACWFPYYVLKPVR